MTVRRYSSPTATANAAGGKMRSSRNLKLNFTVPPAEFAQIKRVALYHETSIAAVVRDYIRAGLDTDRKIIDRRPS